MDKVDKLKLNVVGVCWHQFELEKDSVPHGAKIIHSWSESHLSIHTFVDEGGETIDYLDVV